MGLEAWRSHDVVWVDVIHPNKSDIYDVETRFPMFHPLALEDCLSGLERPKLDEYEDHLFLVLQFPLWSAEHRITGYAEIDLFVGKGYVVTFHGGDLVPLQQLRAMMADEDRRDEMLAAGASHLAHAIIDRLVDQLLPHISALDARVRSFADQIFTPASRHILREILLVRRDLISLHRLLKAQVAIVATLEEEHQSYIHPEMDDYFGDILDHMTKALDLVDENSEFINSLADTADTLASQRINEVMRILTVISVTMLPLTLITGFYGMNVPLPFQSKAASLLGIVGLMIAISVGMLAFFRRKDWL